MNDVLAIVRAARTSLSTHRLGRWREVVAPSGQTRPASHGQSVNGSRVAAPNHRHHGPPLSAAHASPPSEELHEMISVGSSPCNENARSLKTAKPRFQANARMDHRVGGGRASRPWYLGAYSLTSWPQNAFRFAAFHRGCRRSHRFPVY